MVEGETVMPVPEGIISTSAVWSEEVIEEAIVEADAEEATEEYVEGTDDLSELS
jgi:DNA mismatch repair protein MutH